MYNDNLAVRPVVHEDRILTIDFPEDGKLRWRKIVRRSGSRPTGKYPSWKMGRMLQWESPHEQNAFRLLDADPTVKHFCEQPVKITYTLNGVTHYHIPDALVVTATGKFLWEVKTRFNATQPDVLERTNFLSQHLPQYGYKYHMVLGEDLATQPRLNTVLYVLKFGRGDITFIERERIRNIFLHSLQPITWGGVLAGIFGNRGRFHICRLMLEGYLDWNPDAPLLEETILIMRAEGAHLTAVMEA